MFKIPVFFKIILAFIAIYLGVAYSLFLFSKPNYNYRQYSFVNEQATILMRPVMEVFGDGKVSHWYDWQNIQREDINPNITPLKISSGDKKLYRDFGNNLSPENALASLGVIKETAIVEPVGFNDQWSLVFCNSKYDVCQSSNLLSKGKIKILVDGTQTIWGKTKSGTYIQLKLLEYTDRSGQKDVLFI